MQRIHVFIGFIVIVVAAIVMFILPKKKQKVYITEPAEKLQEEFRDRAAKYRIL